MFVTKDAHMIFDSIVNDVAHLMGPNTLRMDLTWQKHILGGSMKSCKKLKTFSKIMKWNKMTDRWSILLDNYDLINKHA